MPFAANRFRRSPNIYGTPRRTARRCRSTPPIAPAGPGRHLPVGEERFVEQTDLVQHPSAITSRTTAGRKHLPFLVEPAVVFFQPVSSTRHPVGVDEVACVVDLVPPVKLQDLRGEHPRVGVPPDGIVHGGEPPRVYGRVVVQEDHVRPPRDPDPGVVPPGESEIRGKRDGGDRSRPTFLDPVDGTVRLRAVIDHDRFEIPERLRADGGEALLQKVLPVPVQDDNGEQGGIRLRLRGVLETPFTGYQRLPEAA